MAGEFLDGCAHYNTGQEALKWTFVAVPFILPTGNPRGGPCLQFRSPVMKTLSHQSSFIWGWRYQTTASQQNQGGTIYNCQHAGVNLGGLRVEADNTLSIFAGNGNIINDGGVQNTGNPTLFGNNPFKLLANTWYWFEIKCEISGSGASDANIAITFRINTQQMLSGSGDCGIAVNSLLLQTPTADFHIFQGTAGNFASNGCDFIFIRLDGKGTLNDFPGDTQVGPYVLPISDQTIQWLATGSPQYTQINEVPPTEDITYIYQQPSGISDADPLGTPGQIDSFLFQPLSPFTGKILAVQLLAFNRKDNEGTRSFTFTVSDTVPTGDDAPPIFYPSDSYIYSLMCWDNDPDTQAAWTITGFNTKKFGVKITS